MRLNFLKQPERRGPDPRYMDGFRAGHAEGCRFLDKLAFDAIDKALAELTAELATVYEDSRRSPVAAGRYQALTQAVEIVQNIGHTITPPVTRPGWTAYSPWEPF